MSNFGHFSREVRHTGDDGMPRVTVLFLKQFLLDHSDLFNRKSARQK